MAITEEDRAKASNNVPGGRTMLKPPRKDAAMGRKEALFRQPVSRPAQQRVARPTGISGQSSTSLADKRMGQMREIMDRGGPELVSYQTNPNMDWRQAAQINTARTQGYNNQRQTALQAMGGIAQKDVAGRSQLENVHQRGYNQRSVEKERGKNWKDRDARLDKYGKEDARQANLWDREAKEQQHNWDVAAANRQEAFGLMKEGVPGLDAQGVMEAGQFDADVTGINVPQPEAKNDRYGFEKVNVYKDGKVVGQRLQRTDNREGTIGAEKVMGPQVKEEDILVAEAVLGKRFDPKAMTPDQEKYINDLRATGQGYLADTLMEER